MLNGSGDCRICGGSGWLIAGRSKHGRPSFKRCKKCNGGRNRRKRLAFVGILIAVIIFSTYLWIT
jgi:hypothetical protein